MIFPEAIYIRKNNNNMSSSEIVQIVTSLKQSGKSYLNSLKFIIAETLCELEHCPDGRFFFSFAIQRFHQVLQLSNQLNVRHSYY